MERPNRLFESEYRFMCVIWDNEPSTSMSLVKKCNEKLGWKKSTTFTMIRKLCDKGYVLSENAIITSLISRSQVEKDESDSFLERTFEGSLPRFLVSFLGGKTISKREADELKELIDRHKR